MYCVIQPCSHTVVSHPSLTILNELLAIFISGKCFSNYVLFTENIKNCTIRGGGAALLYNKTELWSGQDMTWSQLDSQALFILKKS